MEIFGETKLNMNLVINMNGKRYEIENWDMHYDNKKKRYIITGMDYNGMFYQLAFKEVITIKHRLYKVEMRVR